MGCGGGHRRGGEREGECMRKAGKVGRPGGSSGQGGIKNGVAGFEIWLGESRDYRGFSIFQYGPCDLLSIDTPGDNLWVGGPGFSIIPNMLAVHEKSDDLEELGHTQSSNSPELFSKSYPPDGGFWAWATAFGYVSSFGVYQDFYTRIYLTNNSPSAISWIGALTSFLADNVTLISGPLYDRGWFYQLMIVGSFASITVLVHVILRKAWSVLLGVLSGIGMGLTYGPCMAVISQHFSKRRTLVMSLVASGSPLGALIHPIMLNHLLNGNVGFARGTRASAGFVSGLLLIACLSMRTRALSTLTQTASYSAVARKCSRDVPFILITAGSTLFQIGYYFPIFYLQLDSIKHGIDVNFSFYSLVITNAACAIGRCTAGIIAEYTGALNLTIASTVACSALIISMIALSDITSVVVLGLAYGYFSGVYVAVLVPLVTVLTPDLSELGARFGICFAFTELLIEREWSAFSGLLGGPISGALLSSQYRWWTPSLFSGIFIHHDELISLVGSSMFVVVRLLVYRRR
ncbi:major facilitator superfamily domain-containing protein [Suillus paluster]|uniref:major facilitator superfamily domain-containing protein n=1 Tax=Suillus paluster TaxID=48578 RepID=UPI001B883601|nr:major facilitator superfamily domain-containing protein [Suillus paluster]KAG1731651.1 major facilitator superfamily domain-containing protein [Suillus paluster]